MTPTWLLLGMVIGVAATQARGSSWLVGVLGGLLLGPLAFLLYFVPPAPEQAQRTCPACAEVVKAEATLCKHCRQPLPPMGHDTVRELTPVRLLMSDEAKAGVQQALRDRQVTAFADRGRDADVLH